MDQLSVISYALSTEPHQASARLPAPGQKSNLEIDFSRTCRCGRDTRYQAGRQGSNKWQTLLNIALTSSDWLWPALGHDTAGPGLFIKNNDDIRFRFGTNHGPASPSRWWQDLGASSLRLWRDEGKGGRKNENMRGIPVVSAQTLLVKLKCFQVWIISGFCFTAWKLGAVCSDLPGWSLNWRSSRFKGFNFGDQKESSSI